MSKVDALKLNCFGDDARLRHIGVAVRSIDAAAPGAEKQFDPLQNVRVAFVELNGVLFELVEPVGERSPVNGYLKRDKVSLYHVCFEVSDLEGALKRAKQNGFHTLGRPKPAAAFEGRRIAWVFSPLLGLFELLERELPPQTAR
jgi:methylmalonyl-CoA/ethylmalonyl-CoA epimerase